MIYTHTQQYVLHVRMCKFKSNRSGLGDVERSRWVIERGRDLRQPRNFRQPAVAAAAKRIRRVPVAITSVFVLKQRNVEQLRQPQLQAYARTTRTRTHAHAHARTLSTNAQLTGAQMR